MQETTIYLSKQNLLDNYDYLDSLNSSSVWPVIKSNAYGHGLEQITKILSERTFEYFVVQNYFEAVAVWDITDHSVLMLGTETFESYEHMDFTKLTPTVGSIPLLKHLLALNQSISIHLKFNTGMNRQGFGSQEIQEILSLLSGSLMNVTGVLTHFADSDGNQGYTREQFDLFKEILEGLEQGGVNPKWQHVSNSAAHTYIPDSLINASRTGIALYGLSPFEKNIPELKPVLSLQTFLTHKRLLKKGDSVGYGNTFTAPHDMWIGTVPVGYYEGMPRILSSVGVCADTTGTPLSIIGRVSMNLITLDLSKSTIEIGDTVEIYGVTGPNRVSVNADLSGTINYELTTNLKPHIKRITI